MSDTAGRCGWVARGDEDEAAQAAGQPAAYMLTCKRRRLVPRTYFFEGFNGRCVALGT